MKQRLLYLRDVRYLYVLKKKDVSMESCLRMLLDRMYMVYLWEWKRVGYEDAEGMWKKWTHMVKV